MIVENKDLFRYSIALKNSGVTPENIDMLERQILVYLFGKEDARKIVVYVIANKLEINTDNRPINPNTNFGGDIPNLQPVYTYGELTNLVKGDGILFSGLTALLSVLICANLLSQNRIQVARQNVTKQPISSRTTTRREEADVVQSLAYTARSLIYAMDDFLKQEGNNPLGIHIRKTILPVRYSTNTSGRIPANFPYFTFLNW